MADRLDIDRKFMKLAAPLLSDGRWREMTRFVQHGRTTCLTHCMAVAYYSLLFVEVLRIPCDRRSLVRGALLHDYFLYDWHVKDENHKWHGFRHAKKALENASRDFELTPIEMDIIVKHMFPLNIKLPKYRESCIVSLADKICSSYETIWQTPCFSILQKS